MPSLKRKLTIIITIPIIITVTALCLVSNWLIKHQFTEYVIANQRGRMDEIVSSISEQYRSVEGGWDLLGLSTIGMNAIQEGFLITVYDLEDEILWDAQATDRTLCNEVMNEICDRMETELKETKEELSNATFEARKGDRVVGYVEIKYHGPYFYTSNDSEFLSMINYSFFIIGGIALLFAFVAARMLAMKMSNPIVKAIEATNHIAKGEYSYPLRSVPIKEFDELATSINAMAMSIEQQEKLRKQLTADMAHELRTPLTSVSTHLEAMLTGIWEVNEDRLDSCYEEINRIIKLVQDLEKVANVENGLERLNKTSFDMVELMKRMNANFAYQEQAKHLDVRMEGESLIVKADYERMGQVITNLISNAVKYTNDGDTILLRVIKEENWCVCEFVDTGAGIRKEELPFIFERFYRADKSRNRKTGGTGVGLTIVKSIMDAHQGKISVSSEIGVGTTVKLYLPLERNLLYND